MKRKKGTGFLYNYSSPISIDEIAIIGTDGYLAVRDSLLTIVSPRDTFDSKGFFIKPPVSLQESFHFNKDYEQSLARSLDFFISHVKKREEFDVKYFDNSLLTNRMIFQLSGNDT